MLASRYNTRTDSGPSAARRIAGGAPKGSRSLCIGWIGGLSRASGELERVAREEGHELITHDGNTTRRSMHALRALVARCDLVVVQTDVNSHGAMKVAREAARYYERPLCLVKRASAADLRALLNAA